jgi:GH15 family glucan-1,4-alpha-glucosidase
MQYAPIENYGLIGNMYTTALVGLDGSIDFMCFPDFDSPSIFTRLLDEGNGGYFKIHPVLERGQEKQIYLTDTPILLSRFLSAEGVAEVSDFMPIVGPGTPNCLIRRAKAVRGEIHFEVTFSPRFDYARASHRVEEIDRDLIFISDGSDGLALSLRSDIPLEVKNGVAQAKFTLQTGESAAFILSEAGAASAPALTNENFVSQAFKDTTNYWRGWVGGTSYSGRWREMVYRSAITLKLLSSEKYGSLVAAPTFGLPEQIGGARNWDYRYTWIRDSSFTVYALMRLGCTKEARRFMNWIKSCVADANPDGSIQIMYGLDGRKVLTETELTHLEGYRRSSPVRIGNAAYDQLQLDIYGELMDSVYIFNKHVEPIHHDLWGALVRLVDWVCKHWRQPDEGIWEVRGEKREFSYSRLMCWVALDRGIRLAQKRSFPAPLERWVRTRDEIYRDLFENFWDPARRTFVQYLGTRAVDASTLLMPLVKFISPTDPRWLSTLRAIEADLVDDSLVYRYRVGEAAQDGLSGEEGTFSICSFWYIEALGRSGDLDMARFLFDKMLGYANHVGLYSEELGPHGEHLGNTPQAFTHLALISAAFDLDRRLSRSGRVG